MRRAVGQVAGVLGLVVAVGSILAHFGSLAWTLDLVANFRPQMAVTLLVLGGLALLREPRIAAIVLVVGLTDAALVAPYVMPGGSGIVGGASIEVVSFNVGVSNPNRSEVAAYLAEEDPDVVFLFESSFEWENTIRSADLPLAIVTEVPRGSLAGVTVLVRPSLRPLPIDPGIGGESAAVAVDLGVRRIEILGIHPLSPTSAGRSLRRDDMISAAAEWVRSRTAEVVVVGDMNATPWSHSLRSLRLRGGLVDSMRGAGLQPSWPDGWGVLAIPIDHVLHTSGLGSTDRRTGPAFGSAHRPVLVSIGFSG